MYSVYDNDLLLPWASGVKDLYDLYSCTICKFVKETHGTIYKCTSFLEKNDNKLYSASVKTIIYYINASVLLEKFIITKTIQ